MVTVFRRPHTLAALLFAGLLGVSFLSLTPRNALAADADPALGSVTDLLGRQVKVHLPVRRVILGEGRQLYLVAALDTQNPIERIVGWRKDLIQSDPDTYGAYLRKFPDIAKIPTFGGFEDGTFDIEQAISQRPDVIILNIEAQHATEDARYIEKLDALGIPVVYVDFRNNPMQNTEPTMRLFGQLFGKQARAEAFIDFRNQQIRRVTDVIEARHPARPKVFIERIGGYTDDCCLSFGNENFGLFVEMAGGDNIAKGIIPTTFGQLNAEQVVVANPAQVVVTSANWEAFAPGGHWVGVGPGADMAQAREKLAWYTQRPAYAGIKAQDDQAFHAIWHQFYNSPYQFVAIQQLAKWFHPTLFADLDPDASFRQLHEQFLPVPYEPGYAVSLRQTEDQP
ncbi:MULTISPECIES: ABC transporter substrate-binding protein [unclassified Pseudomonas]|uniref:ABC transporter substrate-binding protein n=1 Tax=unclassified Pseudomonas TaxID=196821 RepID=UPI0008712A63|nr:MULTISPECIES: ABC transporter substrate-binding protein [unclassified Pseudomonas]SCW33654.1 iron complex transport system substrate-binding protein [Pseudomonas sp. NFACC05-1]SCZ20031.1 iron complex transport system substrate-binding protein [Pseudomonas sp. NFACC44-2]SDA45130.1 iron complex transport system substrate-binding protein [Pseudomonas sp. NFACC51]SFH06645.1 iron complex transport system substrate-binding protein [Pseudomonas sp. NFACC54]SFS40954.1 iron complex transport system 